MDYDYFGPPVPVAGGGIRRSPYWPRTSSWSLTEMREKLPELLIDLKTVADNCPGGAIPRDLECSCEGSLCMLPIFETMCALQKIPRCAKRPKAIPRPVPPRPVPVVEKSMVHWVSLIHRIKRTNNWSRFSEIIGVECAERYVQWYQLSSKQDQSKIDSDTRAAWLVVDLDSLAYAVSIDGSRPMESLIARCRC